MPPAGRVDWAQRKREVRARIALRRAECVIAVRQLARPISLAEQAIALWRSLPGGTKWVGISAGLLLTRKLGAYLGGAKKWLRYAPIAMQAMRVFSQFRARRSPAETAPV